MVNVEKENDFFPNFAMFRELGGMVESNDSEKRL